MLPKPVQLSRDIAESLTSETVEEYKRIKCESYNGCLSATIKHNWANFSCNHCSNYTMPDHQQQVSDVLALRVVLQAADYVVTSSRYVTKDGRNVLKEGSANRIKGAKPGNINSVNRANTIQRAAPAHVERERTGCGANQRLDS